MESKKCLRCGYEWRSALARPSSCSKCKRVDWDKSDRRFEYQINKGALVGETLIYLPWKINQLVGKPDYWSNRIQQDTVSRKIKRLGIPFRVSVHGTGVIYTRTA